MNGANPLGRYSEHSAFVLQIAFTQCLSTPKYFLSKIHTHSMDTSGTTQGSASCLRILQRMDWSSQGLIH